MGDSLVITGQGGGLVNILGGNGGLGSIGKPFIQNIYLTSCEGAGTHYSENAIELLAELRVKDRMQFFYLVTR